MWDTCQIGFALNHLTSTRLWKNGPTNTSINCASYFQQSNRCWFCRAILLVSLIGRPNQGSLTSIETREKWHDQMRTVRIRMSVHFSWDVCAWHETPFAFLQSLSSRWSSTRLSSRTTNRKARVLNGDLTDADHAVPNIACRLPNRCLARQPCWGCSTWLIWQTHLFIYRRRTEKNESRSETESLLLDLDKRFLHGSKHRRQQTFVAMRSLTASHTLMDTHHWFAIFLTRRLLLILLGVTDIPTIRD